MKLSSNEITEILKSKNALLHGHFQLTSGRHSDTYVQCARILEDPKTTQLLAKEMIKSLPEDETFDLVVAPAVGGIIIGYAVALELGLPFFFSERKEGEVLFRRNFHVPKGARVLVVEDVVTTGGSVQELINLTLKSGGEPVAVTSIILRAKESPFEINYYPLLKVDADSWDPSQCVQCEEGLAIDSPGSRALS